MSFSCAVYSLEDICLLVQFAMKFTERLLQLWTGIDYRINAVVYFNAERKLNEMNIQHKIAAQELKKVLDKKSRASEIRRNIFDRETQTYHINMLNSTRAIGNEAYRELIEAKEALEKTEKIKQEIEKKGKEITPLHQAAVLDRATAARLKENEQKLIYSKARELADKHIADAFREASSERYSRLKNYCSNIMFDNGKSVLERFNEHERVLEQQIREKIKKFGMER